MVSKLFLVSLLLAPVFGRAITEPEDNSLVARQRRRGGPRRGPPARGPPARLPPWGAGPPPGVRGPPPFGPGGPPWARWGPGGPPGFSGTGKFFWCESDAADECYYYDGDLNEYYYCDADYCYAYDYDYWCDWDGYCYDYNYDEVDVEKVVAEKKEVA